MPCLTQPDKITELGSTAADRNQTPWVLFPVLYCLVGSVRRVISVTSDPGSHRFPGLILIAICNRFFFFFFLRKVKFLLFQEEMLSTRSHLYNSHRVLEFPENKSSQTSPIRLQMVFFFS